MKSLAAAVPTPRPRRTRICTFALAISLLASAAQAAPSIPFVTGHTPGSLRNDVTAFFGMKITVGAEDLTVTHLGRMRVAGNSQSHQLKLVRVSDKAVLASGTVHLAGGGKPGRFIYAELASPVTLLSSNSYYIVSEETQNGDRFYQVDTALTTRPVATIDSGVQDGNGYIWWTYGSPGYSYGLVDFKYAATANTPLPIVQLSSVEGSPYTAPANLTLHAEAEPSVVLVEFFDGPTKLGEDNSPPFSLPWNGAPAGSHSLHVRGTDQNGLTGVSTPFQLTVGGGVPGGEVPLVTSFVPGGARNDFSGLLGTELVVGNRPLTVTALGRFHLPGNNRAHLVKLIRSTDQADVPGAAATVSLASPGQFSYAPLPVPVTLPPGGRYLLVSEETAGGDAWHDFNTKATPTSAASIVGAAYMGSGFGWSVVHENGFGYGPLNLKHVGDGTISAPTVAITAPANNATFTHPASILLEAFASPGVSLVEFYDQATKLGQDTSAPFQFQWANGSVGNHVLRAVATANGLMATSAPVSISIQAAPPPGQPPTIGLTSPVANSILTAPAQINLETLVSTNTTEVRFFVNNVLLGTDGTSPFGIVWNNPPAGNHTLTAIAAASNGLMATSAPVQLTVMTAQAADGRFIADTLPGTIRNNFTGLVGYRFTTGPTGVLVTALGRYVVAGSSQPHQLKLLRASDASELALVTVNTAGAGTGQYLYAALPAAVTLAPNTSYYLLSEETAGADPWHDSNTSLTPRAIATLDGPAFAGDGSPVTFVDTMQRGFGPLDFQFTSGPAPQPPSVTLTAPTPGSTHTNPPSLALAATASASTVKVEFYNGQTKLGQDTTSPFSFTWTNPPLDTHTLRAIATAGNGLTATSGPVQITLVAAPAPPAPPVAGSGAFIQQVTAGTPRADFIGWVGYKFTTASNTVPVTHLGRYVLSGNSQAHTLRLVRAGDGVELGSVNVALSGAAHNQFLYAALASPINLAPNTAYYLVSQENTDSWYDADTFLTPASIAVLNGPAYIGGAYPWTSVESPNHGFGPIDFLYGTNSVPPPQPPSVTLTTPAPGSTHTNPPSLALAATASASTVKVEFYNGQTKLGQDTTSPFSFTWTSPPLGTHTLRAIATAGNGLTATSAPVQITIQASAPPSSGETAFVVGKQLGTRRNNFDGFLGMVITVGPDPITVTQLGRLHGEGDSQTHTVKIVQLNGTDLPGGTVSVNMAGGTPGTFRYGALAQPVTLSANTTYFIASSETVGGDRWHDVVQTFITGTGVATVDSGIYGGAGWPWTGGGLPGQSFGPVDFKYYGISQPSGPTVAITSPAEGAFLIEPDAIDIQTTAGAGVTKVEFLANDTKIGEDTTAPFGFSWNNPGPGTYLLKARATGAGGQTATSTPVQIVVALQPAGTEREFIVGADVQDLRNNFTGFLGMEITVGPDPITITHLGRMVLPGNSRSHLLKIVDEKTGLDLPGAFATANLAGSTPGQFVYAPLPAPITLPAHELFFIVCEELAGGDHWSDVTRTVVTNALVASVDGGVYGPPFRTGGLAHHSFGPVSFKYLGGASSIRPAISITSPTEGSAFLVPVNLEIQTETRGDIARVEFYRDEALLGRDETSPFSLTWTNPTPGNYNLTARGYTTAGAGATSGVVSVSITTNLHDHDQAFVLSRTAGKLRHNFNGYIGMQFTVGQDPLIVTELGREFIAGNAAVRLLKLIRATDHALLTEVSLDMAGGTPGQFRYATVTSPITLAANTTYYLVSQETVDGDLWHDFDTTVTAAPVATVDGGVYSATDVPWKTAGSAGHAFGPVNFRYHVDDGAQAPTLSILSPAEGAVVVAPGDVLISVQASTGVTNVEFYANGIGLGQDPTSPYSLLWTNPPLGNHTLTAKAIDNRGIAAAALVHIRVTNHVSGAQYHFVQSVSPGSARSDFNGFLGMTFTVGSTPVLVTQLGRFHVEGNTGSHLLKLVRASDRQDIGSVTVSMAGGTPGEFQYASLPVPVTLAPNTIYHLVSEETLDGDLWLDVARTELTSTPVATIDSGVFGSDGFYTGGGLPNHSYVPVDFTYVFSTPPPPPTVTIVSPTHGSTLIQPASLLIATETGAGIAKVEFYAGNDKLGEDTSSPFSFNWAQPVTGVHLLKAVATSHLGLNATSTVVQIHIQAPAPPPPTNSPIASIPFIVTVDPQQLRNDFTGFLGMEITVGPDPIVVTHLGRFVVPGNSQTHTIKFVRWSNGQDVPGAAVTVNLAGASPGQFKYQALASPMTLEANTIYHLVSSETLGGDQWYGVERTSVTATSVATVDAGVYGGPPYVAGGLPNHTYGPVNFQYQGAGGVPGTPRLTVSLRNGSFYIDLAGEAGQTFRLEASHNLIHWTTIGTFTLSGQTLSVQDPNAGAYSSRFYRVVVQ